MIQFVDCVCKMNLMIGIHHPAEFGDALFLTNVCLPLLLIASD